ncbi:MAG: InlB B-repeat-containing protein [Prevotella sp.]|nr:InlB B-repeat-containing protein [Candidatus Prevotella equi]
MNTSTFKKLTLFLLLLLNITVAMADSDVSVELRQQNTPSGWQAVQLPSIAAITSANTFNITTYGASTGSSDNASAINQAITAANAAGGGMVVIPAGTWLSGPITMKSKVVLHINAGATLMMLPFGKYPDGGTHDETYSYKDFTFIGNGSSAADDIIIEGEGETSIIDGQGAPWWVKVEEAKNAGGSFDRHACIRMKKGTRHLFRNFKIQNTPGVNLCVGNKTKTGHVTIHDLWIKNPDSELSSGASHNTDGIPIWDPYVNIYNCTIDTGDDNIVCDSEAHHIHAWNITCKSGHGMSVGSYTVNTHDIIYEGITFNGTGSGFRIKTSADRSGNDQTGSNGAVKNIICRNATMTGCPSPIKITSWYDKDIDTPKNNPTSTVSATTPEFCDILFQNITATAVSGKTSWKHNRPIYLYGRPEMYIHDVTFDNVKINSVLGMFMAFAKKITFKNGCKIVNEKNSGSLLTTEYLAYSDNGSTLLSANASKYNGSESTTTYPVTFKNGSTTYKTYNICPNSYAYPPTEPTKAGATFLGWATSEGGTPVTLAQTQLAAGGTFYAVWESEEQGGGEVTGTESLTAPSNDKDEVSGDSYTTTGQMMTSQKNDDYIKIRTGNNGNTWTFSVTDGYTITGFHVEGWSNNSDNSATITVTSIKADGVEVLNGNKVFQPSSSNKTKIDLTGISAKETLVVTFDNSNITGTDGQKNKQLFAKVSFDYSKDSSSDPSGDSNYPRTVTWNFDGGYTSGQYSSQNNSTPLIVPSSSVTLGEAQNLTIDVTSGKFNTRDGDVQVNQGTKIRVPVTSNSDVVTVTLSSGYGSCYTIGGTLMSVDEVAHTTTNTEASQGYVEIEAIGSGYIKNITVLQNNETVVKGKKTVTYYDYNGSTSLGTQTVTEGESVGTFSVATCTIPAGYTFGGWFTATGLPFTTMSAVIDNMPVYPYIYKQENGYYMIPAGCGNVLLNTLKNIPAGSKIFLPNGTYDFGSTCLTALPDNVSIIGQSQDKVIIRNTPLVEGIGATATLMPGNSNYMQDLSVECSSEKCATQSASRCVTIQDKKTRSVFKNVSLLSGQDTYYSNGGNTQQSYFEDCYITGTVDYICGGGDIVFNRTTFYNLARSGGGNIIFAPATEATTKWGYVAMDCIVDGDKATQDGKFNIGRDWQKSPAATILNTTFKIMPTAAGYTNMSKTAIPLRFHEYNSHKTDGTAITGHNLNAMLGTNDGDLYLSATKAAKYTIANVFAAGQYTDIDAWDPTAVTAQATVSNVLYANSQMTWTGTAPAYLIEDASGNFVAITTSTTYNGGATGYTVRAANAKGGFGLAVAAEAEKAATLSFTASVQRGSDATVTKTKDTETHYYNKWGNSTWCAQSYIGFSVNVPEGKQVKSATLKFSGKVNGGSASSYTADVNCLTSEQATAFNYETLALGNSMGDNVGIVTDYRANYTEHSVPVSGEIMQARTSTGSTSLVIFQIGNSSGGSFMYGKASASAPSLDVEFEDYVAPTYAVTFYDDAAQYGDAQQIEEGQTVTKPTDPTKSGYTFRGWSLTNGGTTAEAFPYTITEVTNFYAIWEENAPEPPAPANATLFSWKSTNNTEEGVTVSGGTATGNLAAQSGLYAMKLADKPSNLSQANHVVISLTNGTFAEGDVICVTGFYSRSEDTETSFGVVPGSVDSGDYGSTAIAGTDTDWPNMNGVNYGNNGFQQVTHYYTLTSDFNGEYAITLTRGSKSGTNLFLTSVEITRASSVTASVAASRTFGTFSSIYNVDFSDASEEDMIAAYTVKYNGGNTVNLSRHRDVLPAGHGVILFAPTDTKSWNFNTVATTNATVADNDMIGVPVTKTVQVIEEKNSTMYYNYIISADAFHPLSAAGNIAAGKAYLSVPKNPNASNAKTIAINFGDNNTTGVDEVRQSISLFGNGKIHNLQGIEVNRPVSGKIYIVNGKKLIMR